MGADKRFGRSERSGRYASDRGRDDPEWRERRDREQDRDYDQRWSDERHTDRFDERRERDGPERRRKRHNSDRSEDGYQSDGDYQEQDYKMELGQEESKTIMLRGLSLYVTEEAIQAALEQLQGPQPVDIRLMKKRTGESCCLEPQVDSAPHTLPPHTRHLASNINHICHSKGTFTTPTPVGLFFCGLFLFVDEIETIRVSFEAS